MATDAMKTEMALNVRRIIYAALFRPLLLIRFRRAIKPATSHSLLSRQRALLQSAQCAVNLVELICEVV